MKRVLAYARPYLGKMGLQFFIKFTGTIVELLLPWMLSVILDRFVPAKDMKSIYLWGVLMILCAALALIENVIANRMATRISRDITQAVRHDLFEKTMNLSCAQTDGFTIPSLISRLTSDTYYVHQMIDRMQRLGIRAPILLLGGVAVTLSLEPVLTLVLIGTLPLLGVVVVFVSRRSVPLYAKTQQAVDTLVRKVQENMTGVRVIKALSKSDYERDRFDEINRDVAQKAQRAGAVTAVTGPVMNLLLNLGLTLVIVVGAFRVNAGVTGTGKIIAFMSYFTIILNALMMVSRLFDLYSKGAASARRIAEVLDAPRGMPQLPQEERASSPYQIEFRNVTFSYHKKQENLTDISFALRRGETLGIIGPTGSGKTTILNLLLRFYDADAGEILLCGKPIATIPEELLHTMFGVTFQNDFLYAGSITENIDFGRALPQERIEHAARAAQAEFIAARDGGFDALLTSRGSNLSGGQKQRLLIARALAADPEILLLDDSSSALDYKTDALLRQALAREYANTTTVIVAQRISSIAQADRILVLEDGRIAGYGTHETLLQSCPSYREIYDIQMGGDVS